MIRHKSPADARPFQNKSVLQQQKLLEAHYGRIAIDDVVAALHHIKSAADARPTAVSRAA